MKSRCSCAVSYQFLQKQWISTVSLIIQTVFGHFDKIFRSSKDHFCKCYFIIKILSVLHRKVDRSQLVCFKAIALAIFLSIASLENHK